MPPPGLQIYLQPRVTLTFDLLTHKVDGFMSLSLGRFVPICIKIGLFVFKVGYAHRFGNRRTDGRTNGQVENIMIIFIHHNASACQSALAEA